MKKEQIYDELYNIIMDSNLNKEEVYELYDFICETFFEKKMGMTIAEYFFPKKLNKVAHILSVSQWLKDSDKFNRFMGKDNDDRIR